MRVILDRSNCIRWQGSCEACFANHLTKREFDTTDCVLDVEEDGRPEIVMKIYDRDGSIKSLVVNEENFGKAYDSWLLLWEEQAGLVI